MIMLFCHQLRYFNDVFYVFICVCMHVFVHLCIIPVNIKSVISFLSSYAVAFYGSATHPQLVALVAQVRCRFSCCVHRWQCICVLQLEGHVPFSTYYCILECLHVINSILGLTFY